MRIVTTATGIQEVHTSIVLRLDLRERARELEIPLRRAMERGLRDEISQITGQKYAIPEE